MTPAAAVAGLADGARADPPAPRAPRLVALGRTDYVACWRRMQAHTAARGPDDADELWMTEHPPVYTLGLAGRPEHVRDTGGIPVVRVDRGGQVTYHGPGQLVAYVLVDLRRRGPGVRALVRTLEAAVVEWLAGLGIDAHGRTDAPGVYVHRPQGQAKIAALGLKVRNGCTYHGVAVNVAMDLAPFDVIDPCGYPGLAVTQVRDLGVRMDVAGAGAGLGPVLARRLAAPFG